jgi:hypothetical protein
VRGETQCLVNYVPRSVGFLRGGVRGAALRFYVVPRSVGFLRERFGGGVRGTTFPGP